MNRYLLAVLLSAALLVQSFGIAADSKPNERLGRVVSDVTLTNSLGASVSLAEFQDKPVIVLAFLGTECPLAKLAVTKLNALAKEFEPRGVAILGVNANRQDSLADLVAQAKSQPVEFPLFKDVGNKLADAVGAERTPEVVVLDQKKTIRYVGRIDDQDGIGFRRGAAMRQDLKTAVEELLAGKPVSVSVTEVDGCFIGRMRAPKPNSDVTYSKQIARILQDRCVTCHRPGQVAPFAMTGYDEVVGWAETIAEVVKDNRMPPWHASPDHGKFANARNLPDDEKGLILDWVKAGAPLGDANDLPPAKTFVDDWQLPRAPDLIVHMRDKPFDVPATGVMHYQYFVVDPKFTEDKWIEVAELQPGDRSAVHHILVFAKSSSELRKFDGDGAFLAAYVPGFQPQRYPTGMAKLVPAGSKLVFQVHYTPNGKKTTDLSRIGFNFADPTKVTHAVMTKEARQSRKLIIPPNTDNHRVEADSPRSPTELQLLNLMPHMHVRGKSFRYELRWPDGREEIMLDVPHYDFNWQTSYQLAEPLRVPAGSVMHCVAHYDNSENNLNNPNPNATVRWGEQTWDEMLIGYFDIAVPRDVIAGAKSDSETAKPIGASLDQVRKVLDRIKELDVNKDGALSADEVPARLLPIFKLLDLDGDKKLTDDEARKALQSRRLPE
jgi:peroxiredoxin